jgi:HlyD family secretion protein
MKLASAAVSLAGLLIISFVVWAFWKAYQPQPEVLHGQIEAREYSVASKIPGRIASVKVAKGDAVEVGQLVFTIASPVLDAKLEQAMGAQQSAGAVELAADKGAREQELSVAYDNWQTIKAAEALALKTYQRIQNLFDDGVVPEQKRDEAFAAYEAARYTSKAAYELYTLTKEGTREETQDAAAGQTRVATALVAEVQALRSDAEIHSSFKGEVSNVFLHPGEIAPPGFPVVTVVDMSEIWAVFQLREDLLKDFTKGTEISVLIPALGDDAYAFSIAHISVMGEFATWRATSAVTGYDMKTFEVEARSLEPIDDLRVGMTVLLKLE